MVTLGAFPLWILRLELSSDEAEVHPRSRPSPLQYLQTCTSQLKEWPPAGFVGSR
jgi:hypothetical protein